MTALSKKDLEILNLRAARMSSTSIAVMVGWSEAKVYNRLDALRVYSAADALDRIAGKSALSLAGLAAFGDEGFALLLKSMVEVIAQAKAVPAPPAPAAVRVEAVTAEPRPAPPRSAPLRSQDACASGRAQQASVAPSVTPSRPGREALAGRRIPSPAACRTARPPRRCSAEARQPTGGGVGGPLPQGALVPGGSGPSVRRVGRRAGPLAG